MCQHEVNVYRQLPPSEAGAGIVLGHARCKNPWLIKGTSLKSPYIILLIPVRLWMHWLARSLRLKVINEQAHLPSIRFGA